MLPVIVCVAFLQMLPMSAAVSLFFTNPAMAVVLDWVVHRTKVSKLAPLHDASSMPLFFCCYCCSVTMKVFVVLQQGIL
jgi:hypothetical protein